MSYIDENLLIGEHILYRTKPHWIIFTIPMVLSIIAISLLMQNSPIELLGYLLLIAAVIQWISAYTTYSSSEYGLTNKRILIKVGFIRQQTIETLLQRIEGIQVEQGLMGRILGFGTIVVCGVGGTKDRFNLIDEPMQFRRHVQEQIEKILIPGNEEPAK